MSLTAAIITVIVGILINSATIFGLAYYYRDHPIWLQFIILIGTLALPHVSACVLVGICRLLNGKSSPNGHVDASPMGF